MNAAVPFKMESMRSYHDESLVKRELLDDYKKAVQRAIQILQNPIPVALPPLPLVAPPPIEATTTSTEKSHSDQNGSIVVAEAREGTPPPQDQLVPAIVPEKVDNDAMTNRRLPIVIDTVAKRIKELDSAIKAKARDPRQVKHGKKELGQTVSEACDDVDEMDYFGTNNLKACCFHLFNSTRYR